MGRIMGIDYGQKRVGLAVSDPLNIFATPLQTVTVDKVTDFIKKYTASEPVDLFVVGYPRHLNNTPAQNAPRVTAFVTHLKRIFPTIPVILTDERFTSKMAFQAMIDGGLKKKDRRDKATIDKISAVLILQEYLQNNTL
ncbi:MAG: Holliday junction resolvase RuvX [Bacteroidales bacterium]|jgi:putative Holliday junction resolvase|nr:Holliday junction resolvase RuvX [Bacteroidales bacterium]MDD2771926.1 Holliday junction resolvase RuvX [Bacteroidales bacterium]MDD3104850.1 Holliday junction resolvase RuvX [Bacteroidales bacterium]MDD3549467.1 Holliday junction resolvase RuvX [Bacteroidales bacterium]MDD4064495.1 Holliday junction resolvase RuvX [Bacteroidales bacterium]